MAKVRFRLKDPERWLPAWARGKGLSVTKIRVAGSEFAVSGSQGRGGFVVEVDDDRPKILPWAKRLEADPRFEKV